MRDSGARVLIVSADLLPQVEKMSADVRARLRHVVVTGAPFAQLLASGSESLEAEPTHRDAPAFWLYSSGSTGRSKG